MSSDAAVATTRALVDELGLVANPRELRNVPAVQIVAAQVRVLGGQVGAGPPMLGPVVDGTTLARHPLDPTRHQCPRRSPC
jgi:carboxylesterase type B